VNARALLLAATGGVLGACAEDLLPGELVVPGELSTTTHRGEPGSALGASVALDGAGLLAGAPGLGQVWQLGTERTSQGPAELGRWVWWREGVAYAARASDGVYRVDQAAAERVWETPGAQVFAAGEGSAGFVVAAASAQGVQLWDGDGIAVARLDLAGVQRLAVGWERVLLSVCEADRCEVLAWEPVRGETEVLGVAGQGGDLVEVDGLAWWGDPQLDTPTGTGRVCAEDGRCLEGLEGDHLGRRLCATHAAGVFNTWIVPARLRIVPLEGGEVLAVDRGAPSRPPALDSQDGLLAVGLPSDGLNGWNEGRVLWVVLP
jgi:hypothetical protein